VKKVLFLLACITIFEAVGNAGILQHGKVQLLCHRTANRDMPENTLESLELAARLGCNVVEIDLTRTLGGQIVLNHDDFLERLTNGMGKADESYLEELQMLDAGSWMGKRYAGMRIPLFEDALRVAREQGIGLILDFKSKGMGPEVLRLLRVEDMLDRVQFGGESSDAEALYPAANSDQIAWLGPLVSRSEVDAKHTEGKLVIANFSANAHDMDMPAMRAAVAAGVDGINVDYPRLGADAIGRPVEEKIRSLVASASAGSSASRSRAILELAHYNGFPLQRCFQHWLVDDDTNVSRAAAIALVMARPRTQIVVMVEALKANSAHARANAAWAIGMLGSPANGLLFPLLTDKDPEVLKETLLVLSRSQEPVSAEHILPFLSNKTPVVRGAAALALARHQPSIAVASIREELEREERTAAIDYAEYVRRGKPKLTQAEIDPIVESYRCQMKLVQALNSIEGPAASSALSEQAFREVEDHTLTNGILAGYEMWDRTNKDPTPAIEALASSDNEVANRAEWTLIKAGPVVLPSVRRLLLNAKPSVRERAIRIVAWQGDVESVSMLQTIQSSDTTDAQLIAWALAKIDSLQL
jgi:glycerophosphoryl diester phosphodiesterase/HEAT repeat protein